jgi:methylated-DNA-[protein]-cysteine S-methyltransferase
MEIQPRSSPAPEGGAQPVRVLLPSPIGPLGIELLGATVTRVLIDPGEAERSTFTPFLQLEGPDWLDEIFGRLAEYFAGARRKLDLEFGLGACEGGVFARRVLKETARIGYGRTRTYRDVAEAAGRPDGSHEAMAVLLANPLPIVVPCHRVVADDGGPGEYVGGPKRKRWLLDLESQSAELT